MNVYITDYPEEGVLFYKEWIDSNDVVKKAIIFTESMRRQEYLNRILENTEHKDRIVLFNGSNNDQKPQEIYKKWLEKHFGRQNHSLKKRR